MNGKDSASMFFPLPPGPDERHGISLFALGRYLIRSPEVLASGPFALMGFTPLRYGAADYTALGSDPF